MCITVLNYNILCSTVWNILNKFVHTIYVLRIYTCKRRKIFDKKEIMENSEDNQEKSYWFLKFVSEKITKVKSTLLDKLDPGMKLVHQK